MKRNARNHGPTERLSFEAPGDHIVLVAPDRRSLLLDTGSPVSHGDGTLELLGRCHKLDAGQGLDLGRAGELVGTHLDGLLGTDVVAHLPFGIDWASQTLVFGSEAARAAGTIVPLTSRLGIPEVKCEVAGRTLNALVDTGAVISFFTRPWNGLPSPTGARHEFFVGPNGLEEFDTPLWSLPVSCGESFEATFGQLPAGLSRALKSFGIEVIMGADLWKQFQIGFDFEGGRLVVGAGNRDPLPRSWSST